MGDLTKVPHVLDSREVAEMVGKTHAHLCRDIDLYVKVISENPKLDSQNFFIKMRRKTPSFRAGDIRRVRRICVSN